MASVEEGNGVNDTGRILLIRHAETIANADARWHGPGDISISPRGREEAAAAGARLKAALPEGTTLILSSHLRRAVETAEIIARAMGVPEVKTDARLAERDMGLWAGRSPAEVEQLWPGVLAAWVSGEIDGPPSGETDTAVAQRARTALAQPYLLATPGVILVVTHGGVIRSLGRTGGLPNIPVPHLGGYEAILSHSGEFCMKSKVQFGDPEREPLT